MPNCEVYMSKWPKASGIKDTEGKQKLFKAKLNERPRVFVMHVTPAINTPEVNQVEDNAEEQRCKE